MRLSLCSGLLSGRPHVVSVLPRDSSKLRSSVNTWEQQLARFLASTLGVASRSHRDRRLSRIGRERVKHCGSFLFLPSCRLLSAGALLALEFRLIGCVLPEARRLRFAFEACRPSTPTRTRSQESLATTCFDWRPRHSMLSTPATDPAPHLSSCHLPFAIYHLALIWLIWSCSQGRV